MTLKQLPALTIDTNVNHKDCYQTFEWFTERGGWRYSDFIVSESENDDCTQDHNPSECDGEGDGEGQTGKATYASDSGVSFTYVYRPCPKSPTEELPLEEDTDKDNAPPIATVDAAMQAVYQKDNVLRYYGYTEYDLARLGRTNTAHSITSTGVEDERQACEEEYEGEDEEDEEEEDDDDDDLYLAHRRWHCPHLER